MDPQWWHEHFGSTEPIGYELRKALPGRWFRIHSLPESKRYPETDDDWEILIARHREVAEELIPPGSKCCLLVPWCCVVDPCFKDLELLPAPELPFYHQADPEIEPEGPYFAATLTWNFEAFEPVVRKIALWQTIATVVAMDTATIYAPYDGGADFILPDTMQRDAAKEKFCRYLSKRADGC